MKTLTMRSGNKASAKFWRQVLLPVIEPYRHCNIPKLFRGDAAFAKIEWHRGELFPRVGFIVTNLTWRDCGADRRANNTARPGEGLRRRARLTPEKAPVGHFPNSLGINWGFTAIYRGIRRLISFDIPFYSRLPPPSRLSARRSGA